MYQNRLGLLFPPSSSVICCGCSNVTSAVQSRGSGTTAGSGAARHTQAVIAPTAKILQTKPFILCPLSQISTFVLSEASMSVSILYSTLKSANIQAYFSTFCVSIPTIINDCISVLLCLVLTRNKKPLPNGSNCVILSPDRVNLILLASGVSKCRTNRNNYLNTYCCSRLSS